MDIYCDGEDRGRNTMSWLVDADDRAKSEDFKPAERDGNGDLEHTGIWNT